MAIFLTGGYVLCIRVLIRKSRDIDKQIDYSRIRRSQGEDDRK